MESEANKTLTTIIPIPDNVIPTPRLNSDLIRHIATFLDFQSLRLFRLVSPEWNAACLAILMKRGTYKLTHKCNGSERADLYQGANHYSSWKISHSVYESAKILHDKQRWGNVRSLTIHQLTPLSKEFHCWAWETIQSRCPNLEELTFIFETISYSQPEREVYKDYKRAIKEKPIASFPKISNLRNLKCVTFRGIYNNTTAYFAQHLLQACTTSLRHLYFCPMGEAGHKNLDEGEAYRIFDYLKQNPRLLSNLQTFGFYVGGGSYSATRHVDETVLLNILYKESAFTKFIKGNNVASLPSFQFSENLQSLFWDSPFHLNCQLLPGVLTPSVSSSLVQLSLNGRVESLGEGADNDNDTVKRPIKISFPNFPRLRALKLGFLACRSLSVPELIDSAPNLSVLEIGGLSRKLSIDVNPMSYLWRGSEEGSVPSPKPHLQLRIFCTNSPFKDGLSTLQMISSKFCNLVEVRLGQVRGLELDSFLGFVQSRHPELKRLSWTFEGRFTLPELSQHVIRVPEQLQSLTSYSFGYESVIESIQCSVEDLEISTNSLLSLLSSSSLLINLQIKFDNCRCEPEEEESVRNVDCKPCYLREFIRKNNLPIRIPSERERAEMEDKLMWNHRFASFRIYR
jgi:hypothetical protein